MLRHCLPPLFALFLIAASAHAQSLKPGDKAVVVDDGNNLREYGGPDYKTAKILATLNKGEMVLVLDRQSGWTQVRTVGMDTVGWVNSKCLTPLAAYLADPKNKDDVYCPASLPRSFRTNLDRAHQDAWVTIEDTPTLDGGAGRLVVKDAHGALLWQGPAFDMNKNQSRFDDPLVFFCSNFGANWPEIIGDIDGDGAAEIVAALPQSDVSVSSFTVSRWNGKAFAPVKQGVSLLESKPGSGRFAYQPYSGSAGYDGTLWLFPKALQQDGLVLATVTQFKGQGPRVFEGKVLVRMDAQGATLVKWVTQLAEVK